MLLSSNSILKFSQKVISNPVKASKLSDKEKVKTQYTFALALIIVSAYIVFFGVAIYQNPVNYEGLKTVTATFGIIVAAVVGYYFGQRPVESAQLHAQEAENRAQKVENEAREFKDLYYKQLSNSLERIKKEYGVE